MARREGGSHLGQLLGTKHFRVLSQNSVQNPAHLSAPISRAKNWVGSVPKGSDSITDDRPLQRPARAFPVDSQTEPESWAGVVSRHRPLLWMLSWRCNSCCMAQNGRTFVWRNDVVLCLTHL